jgi:cell shape-determining protein MreD
VKLFAGILVLGALAAIIQGVLGTFVSQQYVPDLGLLLVFAVGVSWRGFAGGFGAAIGLGYITDLLSGSLLGQHVVMRIFVFVAARLGSRHLSLLGAMPRALMVAGLTLVNAFAMEALTTIFTGSGGFVIGSLTGLLPQIFLNALCAAPLTAGVERMVALLSDDESARKLSIETGGGRLA